jgi:hypothetical protein
MAFLGNGADSTMTALVTSLIGLSEGTGLRYLEPIDEPKSYAVHPYFSGPSPRRAAGSLGPIASGSHASMWGWAQRSGPSSDPRRWIRGK